jgi:hypothetical protein
VPVVRRRDFYVAPHRPDSAMNDFWGNWMEAVRFTCEAQSVISARLMLFASGAPNAVDEAAEMVAEKIAVFAKARMAAEQALCEGHGFYSAAERAYSPIKTCVHANSDRLLGAHSH